MDTILSILDFVKHIITWVFSIEFIPGISIGALFVSFFIITIFIRLSLNLLRRH